MLKDFLDRRKKEEEGKSSGRLPPGQSLTQKFPVLHYGPVPMYDNLDTWTFKFSGLVEEAKTFTWKEFNELPRRKMKLDLHCVTRWSKFDTDWEGIHLKDLVDQGIIKIKPEASYCVQHCEFGYTTNLPTATMLEDNFLLATTYDGKPLEAEHGYPLRGLMGAVPGAHVDADRYLWKGGKWLRGLEFVKADQPGFWEQAGYSNSARIWSEERYWTGLK
jgi:DMSO/TMAO reductase YedYZ molybdopterin-dependent catalytic subunit